jgi:hypothetical protein
MQKLTAELVEQMIGPADPDLITEIMDTNASVEELIEAKSWLEEDLSAWRETHRQPAGWVAILCRILAASEPSEDRDA